MKEPKEVLYLLVSQNWRQGSTFFPKTMVSSLSCIRIKAKLLLFTSRGLIVLTSYKPMRITSGDIGSQEEVIVTSHIA
jgi:hypothetical protein